jgi:hypothetical protein
VVRWPERVAGVARPLAGLAALVPLGLQGVPGPLQPARARPYVLDDATVARIIRVHRDQAGDLTLFQNQADRWKTDPGLTAAQRADLAA